MLRKKNAAQLMKHKRKFNLGNTKAVKEKELDKKRK